MAISVGADVVSLDTSVPSPSAGAAAAAPATASAGPRSASTLAGSPSPNSFGSDASGADDDADLNVEEEEEEPGGRGVGEGGDAPEPRRRSKTAGSLAAAAVAGGSHLRHHLPAATVWSVVILTALGVAVANFCIVWASWFLIRARQAIFQALVDLVGAAPGLLLASPVVALPAAAAAALVAFVAPVSAGGGLPELKSFLNGSRTAGLFSARAFWVRLVGIVLSISAGFPIGREGPTIVIGGNIGYAAVYLLALPRLRRPINLESSKEAGFLPAMIEDEERLALTKRIGCTVGAAAGMATIFNAPIGGLLYMVEEVNVASWTTDMTLKAIMCTVMACLANRALLNVCGDSVTRFLIFSDESHRHLWDWQDMPPIVIISALLGASSGLYTHALTGTFALRRRWSLGAHRARWPRVAKVLEVAVYAVFCALVISALTFSTGCRDDREWRIMEGIRVGCEEGEFNPIATLLFNGPEEAIKFLYSRENAMRIGIQDMLVTLVCYVVLNIGMMGLSVPMGSFIPFMLAGALAGRILGHLIGLAAWLPFEMAKPGMYTLIGSAALLAGSLHQTLSIVVFLMECVNQLDAISPLMVSVFVAHFASKAVSRHGLDEQLILRKGLPYLDAEAPESLDSATCVASDLCAPLPAAARLAPWASVAEARAALEGCKGLSTFPVVEGGACVGLITRKRLLAAIGTRLASQPSAAARRPAPSASAGRGAGRPKVSTVRSMRRTCSSGPFADEDDEMNMDTYIAAACRVNSEEGAASATPGGSKDEVAMLPLYRIMDAAPHVLLENTPAPRLYPLFARLGISVACVTSSSGDLYGLLTRAAVIKACSEGGEGEGEGHSISTWFRRCCCSCRSAPSEAVLMNAKAAPSTATDDFGVDVELGLDGGAAVGDGAGASAAGAPGAEASPAAASAAGRATANGGKKGKSSRVAALEERIAELEGQLLEQHRLLQEQQRHPNLHGAGGPGCPGSRSAPPPPTDAERSAKRGESAALAALVALAPRSCLSGETGTPTDVAGLSDCGGFGFLELRSTGSGEDHFAAPAPAKAEA